MNKILTALMATVLLMVAGCANTSGGKYDNPSEYSSDMEVAALAAAQSFIRSQYAADAVFDGSQVTIEPTFVENRYKVMQRFDSEQRDGYNFVYRIWVQKFPTGWEFGNLGIERAGGERVLTTNGRMKEIEQADGMGDKLTAGGVEFTIVEKNPTAIRISTQTKLDRKQLKAAIIELKTKYETIQFATSDKPQRGEEYASWTGNMFFDYDADEIISKGKFLQ